MDALVLEGDEGRGKLRYASGSCKQTLIRRFPNGKTFSHNTRKFCSESIGTKSQPSELKHLSNSRKRKRIDFRSSGERTGNSLNRMYVKPECVVHPGSRDSVGSGFSLAGKSKIYLLAEQLGKVDQRR